MIFVAREVLFLVQKIRIEFPKCHGCLKVLWFGGGAIMHINVYAV